MIDRIHARLTAALGSASVATGDGAIRVLPDTTAAACLAFRMADEMDLSIRVEGGGTWLPTDAPADIIMSTRRLVGTLDASPADLVATVDAGITIGELQRRLTKQRLWLAIDPPGSLDRTMGSILATGTAGPLRTGYGPVRDHVLGCTVVTADGRVVESGGQVVKNVAGFDLTKLQVGGFGAFGMFTAVHLRLRALPRQDATLVARGSRDRLTAAGRALSEQAVELAAGELLSPAVTGHPDWMLAARLVGSEAAVQAGLARLRPVTGIEWDAVEADGAVALWRQVAEATTSAPVTFRLGVLAEGLNQAQEQLGRRLDLGLVTAGAVAGGLRWTGRATPEQISGTRQAMAQLEIPLTLERAPWLVRSSVGHFGAYREGVRTLVDRLRLAFDPAGRLQSTLEGVE